MADDNGQPKPTLVDEPEEAEHPKGKRGRKKKAAKKKAAGAAGRALSRALSA